MLLKCMYSQKCVKCCDVGQDGAVLCIGLSIKLRKGGLGTEGVQDSGFLLAAGGCSPLT